MRSYASGAARAYNVYSKPQIPQISQIKGKRGQRPSSLSPNLRNLRNLRFLSSVFKGLERLADARRRTRGSASLPRQDVCERISQVWETEAESGLEGLLRNDALAIQKERCFVAQGRFK
jgi:hypothetical protein